MAVNYPNTANNLPSAPDDLPPPYSAVVGNPQYGFVVPPGEQVPAGNPQPKFFTAPGVYPHPPVTSSQPQSNDAMSAGAPPPNVSVPVGVVMAPAVGVEPATVVCYNCSKVVTTRVTHLTVWHTHLVAASICIMTMACSLCCLGLVPYCFDTFKDAEHYCPNCNTYIGTSKKC